MFSAEKSSNNSEQDMNWIIYSVMCKDLQSFEADEENKGFF